jgi:DNA-binding CsgD family transcriptional regulator
MVSNRVHEESSTPSDPFGVGPGATEQVARDPKQGDESLLVSATGTWRTLSQPLSPRERADLPSVLGIRSTTTARRLRTAVERASNEGSSAVLPMEAGPESDIDLLHVRPARERGHALVSRKRLTARTSPPDPAVLREIFKLTETEASIACALLESDELRDIADARGVSIETVRMHVKNLLLKTRMPNQKKLTALLTRLAAMSLRSGSV